MSTIYPFETGLENEPFTQLKPRRGPVYSVHSLYSKLPGRPSKLPEPARCRALRVRRMATSALRLQIMRNLSHRP